jgi:pilus assembly protein Flp/PilA
MSAALLVYKRWVRSNQRGVGNMHHFFQILRDSKGATAIEYGLIATLIAIAAITAMTSVGTKLKTTFSNVGNNLKAT